MRGITRQEVSDRGCRDTRYLRWREEESVHQRSFSHSKSCHILGQFDSDSDDDGLGIENGTFKCNEVPEETKADDGKSKGKTGNGNSMASTDDSDTAVDSESVTAALENEDHRFELRDISAIPRGRAERHHWSYLPESLPRWRSWEK
ncbi:hypothetical protein BV22DRAFT_1135451 [Leucogyrophana mollusca]|uniref:Uncharacterized protein n=1 Tax=Leucogyrophana mollusca TaxID=85980 RepID=A0ACB8AWM8_9AGAM|nr:hypothetical protein BV22DRAFT_1135451 [Leucogyrophana mollusca]